MIKIDRTFTQMLAWQFVATSMVGMIAFFVSGKNAAISASLGGFSVIFATVFASLINARNKNKHDAAAILVSALLAEAVKLILVFVFLFIVFKQYKNLMPAALIASLAVAAILSGLAISKTSK